MTPPTHALARDTLTSDRVVDRPRSLRPAPQPAPPRTTVRVLVLDGDPHRSWLLSDAVARAGGEGALARSGAEALAMLRDATAELDAVLVGGLPDGSRRGFVAWAAPRFGDLAMLAVAADAGEATELYHAGADIVMTPPLDPDLLGAKLAAALRRARPQAAPGAAG